MTGSENDAFMQLMMGSGVGAGIKEMPYDGRVVTIDSDNGEVFREDLRNQTKAELGLPPEMPFGGEITLTSRAADMIRDSLSARILAPDAPIRANEWLVINGLGLIAGMGVDEDEQHGLVVDESFNVFGRLAAAGYSVYPVPEDYNVVEINDETEEYAGELTSGLIVVLTKVKVCEASGNGTIQEELDYATVPLAADGIQFHHVLNPLA